MAERVISACEAGASIKPGASAPGRWYFKSEPAERAKDQRILRLPPVSRADETGRIFPGADAPGFMLTPASQAKKEIGGGDHNP